jgi:DNA-binding CsgD family transcriptional regulator
VNRTSSVTDQGTRAGERTGLRLAVYWPTPTPTARPVPDLTRGLGGAVRARVVHRPQEVRASDDLVVVAAGARTFVPVLTDTLGSATPPVLVVVRRAEQARVPVSPGCRVAGYLVVDNADLGGLVENLMLFAALATARRTPAPPPVSAGLVHSEPLTPRERDVMTLLASGRSVREIAEALAIGGKTVRNVLSNIYRKLGVRRQTEALIRWLSIGQAQPSN